VFVRTHGGVRRAVDGRADEFEALAKQLEVRTRIVFLTTVRSGTRSNSSATVSIRKAGGA
jgi:hypothetical protein